MEIEEIYLNDRVQQVVTYLGKDLRKDSLQISGGHVDPKQIQLPTNDVAPFAVHFTDGSLILFWSTSLKEKLQWVRAFKKLEVSSKAEVES